MQYFWLGKIFIFFGIVLGGGNTLGVLWGSLNIEMRFGGVFTINNTFRVILWPLIPFIVSQYHSKAS